MHLVMKTVVVLLLTNGLLGEVFKEIAINLFIKGPKILSLHNK